MPGDSPLLLPTKFFKPAILMETYEILDGVIADTHYLVSACLSVRNRGENGYRIAHLLTGKQFQIKPDVVRVLQQLQQAITMDQLYDALPDLPPAAIDLTIQFLLKNKLVFDATSDTTEDLFYVHQPADRLFNLPENKAHSTEPGAVFIGVPYGGGNNLSSGCEQFPSAVRAYTKRQKIDFGPDANLTALHFRGLYQPPRATRLIRQLTAGFLRDGGDLMFFPFESSRDVFAKITRAARLTFRQKQVPILLGGDHSISYGAIQAAVDAFGAIQVLHFDAHCDTYRSGHNRLFAQRGVHNHGTFMTRSLELPGLKHVTQIGLRGFTNVDEHDSDRRTIVWADDIRQALTEQTLPQLKADWPLYITFDIDVLDPASAPATATPVPGGISYDEVCQLLNQLLPGQRIIGIDLVEVNPDRDRDQITLQLAAQLLLLLTSYI